MFECFPTLSGRAAGDKNTCIYSVDIYILISGSIAGFHREKP
jgi:hypothetical protein